MTTNTFLPRAAAVLAAGGLAWLAKMAIITATDGAVSDGATAAGFLYLLGIALMPVGLAAVAVALTASRPIVLRALAGVGGLLSFFVCYVLLDGIAKAVVGDAGPSWLQDEVGILATGTALMAAGLLTARRAAAPRLAR
ncbi:MAG: hypothetical protein ACRDPC_09090 [Solirubrobacteraceae bacterium]